MAKTPTTANWQSIDPTTLPKGIADAYAAYKQQYTVMKKARTDFETLMAGAAAVPAGKRLIFGYNFGKLSVAVVDDETKPAVTKGALSLSAFLANSGGRRT